ncbi:hypothetical protein ANANG_G00274910, partial [Anguilla anguilla]
MMDEKDHSRTCFRLLGVQTGKEEHEIESDQNLWKLGMSGIQQRRLVSSDSTSAIISPCHSASDQSAGLSTVLTTERLSTPLLREMFRSTAAFA